MSVDLDDEQGDDFRANLARLRRCDVSRSRARQLRRRCHAMLQVELPANRSARMVDEASFRRVAAPALGAALCLAYLVEVIRCTAAIYTYFGAQ